MASPSFKTMMLLYSFICLEASYLSSRFERLMAAIEREKIPSIDDLAPAKVARDADRCAIY